MLNNNKVQKINQFSQKKIQLMNLIIKIAISISINNIHIIKTPINRNNCKKKVLRGIL